MTTTPEQRAFSNHWLRAVVVVVGFAVLTSAVIATGDFSPSFEVRASWPFALHPNASTEVLVVATGHADANWDSGIATLYGVYDTSRHFEFTGSKHHDLVAAILKDGAALALSRAPLGEHGEVKLRIPATSRLRGVDQARLESSPVRLVLHVQIGRHDRYLLHRLDVSDEWDPTTRNPITKGEDITSAFAKRKQTVGIA
ncbi:MAG: hypothetical protein H0U74_06010 [Bradymonadaceae bacterium]|nr:hypothetical protein [Lujinxingiaceae bacterium]